MGKVKTPASIAAAASALNALVEAAAASSNSATQAKAPTLNTAIEEVLLKASHLDADDVRALLGTSDQLKTFDQKAKTAATTIANDASNVDDAISFCTAAVAFVGAVATGQAVEVRTQLSNMQRALHT